MRKPDFLIIGSQKSGTTALKYYLNQHPDIWCPSDELHFFDQRLHRGMEWYLSHFTGRTEKVVGEKTPAYLYKEYIPKMIKEMKPDIKLIALLREPVSRAYSEYNMIHLKGQIPYSFEKLVLDKNGEVRPERVCIQRGMYANQLTNLYKYFSKNQVLILKAEDLRENRKETLEKVYDFLGVKYWIPEDMSDRHVGGEPRSKVLMSITGFFTGIQCVRRRVLFDWITWCDTKVIRFFKCINKRRGYKPMKDETRKKLEDYYKEPNKELYELEGITWNEK